MARPTKSDDWFVHRIADLIRYSNLPFSEVPERFRREYPHKCFRREYPDITSQRDIQCRVGELLCILHKNPEHQSWVLHQLADALEGKSAKKRKSGKADEIEKTKAAWRKAQAKLSGLYKGDDPTFQEVDAEFYQDNGWHLTRRALEKVGCRCRPDTRPGRRGRKK